MLNKFYKKRLYKKAGSHPLSPTGLALLHVSEDEHKLVIFLTQGPQYQYFRHCYQAWITFQRGNISASKTHRMAWHHGNWLYFMVLCEVSYHIYFSKISI